ncbi:prolyl oligopeptidase family serine peptidase [Sphingobacterium shayense]|uniref:S9 family peptidase n=1 Tax=Sphingobacterium shayense TaxID=626343 RepID=UPI001554632D|nr:prolyl oligopeptidase family serine peptidase [Sphingobacterium shayense]NQD69676.1 prolyl oligopeptidase family serine peptidase [Sphingobacterium shayense]
MKFIYSIFFLFITTTLCAQEQLTFQRPSAEILELADYQRPPAVILSPDEKWIITLYKPTYKSLEDLNSPEIRLAGLRMNPVVNMQSGATYHNNIKIRPFGSQQEEQIDGLPKDAKLENLEFSPDSKYLAFTHTTGKGVELWLLKLDQKKAKKISQDDLNGNMGSPYRWYRDSGRLLISKLPSTRKPLIDSSKDIPTGPTVSTSGGEVSQLRTYQDLLKNPQDEVNFETLTQTELFSIDLEGSQTKLLKSGIYTQRSFSPDGKYLLVTVLKRPFSYIVPYRNFPQETSVYDLSGKLVKKVSETPLIEIQPKGFSSTRKGKRYISWRSDLASSLTYVAALDDGDAFKEAEFRDELFTWDAPFDKNPVSLMKLNDRYAGVVWGDSHHVIVYSSWYDTRNQKIFLLDPTAKTSKIISDRNSQDVYNDPGQIFIDKSKYGTDVMVIKNDKMFWIGDGYTDKGQFPFVDELNLKTLKKKRLYTSNIEKKKEDILRVLDIEKGDLLVLQQSPTEYPNYFTKNMKSGETIALTHLKNPFHSLEGVSKEVIHYKRNDGVDLNGTLYLPANYNKGSEEKLPLLIWAYPTEFKDKATAGQSTANPYAFTFPYYGSFVYWVTKGYAVLDDASFPIIGEGDDEPNDTFVEQLVANGAAAIDAVDKLGFVDRKRVGIGGHSYGAFMTANLLTYSDLFAVGIARSGAYNRTLTPFGFQREQRNYWDDPNLYNRMSPFMNAHKMKTPLLLIHGGADNNPGTFTLQTERYFQALKNLGAPVRMVILPLESHGYASQENIFHTLWEQDQFLEKYLKNKIE